MSCSPPADTILPDLGLSILFIRLGMPEVSLPPKYPFFSSTFCEGEESEPEADAARPPNNPFNAILRGEYSE